MSLGWIITLVVVAGVGALYYFDRKNVLALREKEIETSRLLAHAAVTSANAGLMNAENARVIILKNPANTALLAQAQGKMDII